VDVSSITKGEETLEKGGDSIYRELLNVASGKATRSETLGYGMISIWNIGPHM
jgi:altronate dehydratase large subunit